MTRREEIHRRFLATEARALARPLPQGPAEPPPRSGRLKGTSHIVRRPAGPRGLVGHLLLVWILWRAVTPMVPGAETRELRASEKLRDQGEMLGGREGGARHPERHGGG